MTIETKFNVDDMCYYMQDNKIKQDNIESIYVSVELNSLYASETTISYCTCDGVDNFKETELFKTKKELINELLK